MSTALSLYARGFHVGSRELQIKNTIRVFAGRAHTSHECFLSFTTQQHTRTAWDELRWRKRKEKKKIVFIDFPARKGKVHDDDDERSMEGSRADKDKGERREQADCWESTQKTKFRQELFPSQSSVSRYVPSQEVVWAESLCDICGYSCICWRDLCGKLTFASSITWWL